MRRILALDPSKTATGWVIVSNKKIIDQGVFKFEHKIPKKPGNNLDRWIEFHTGYSNFIYQMVKNYFITDVCSEFPHGSQSYTATMAFEMVKGVIKSCESMFNIPVTFYTEATCKKHFFDRSKNVDKDETIQAMAAKYLDWYFLFPKHKYEQEAICDALLVLTKHLDL